MEETSVLFRHLPSELTIEERKDLLHHLGAVRVQVMGRSGVMKNTAFAVFPSQDEATKIVKQLHQVKFLSSTLKVEFARGDDCRVSSVVDNEGSRQSNKDDQQGETTEKKQPDTGPDPKEIKFDDTFSAWGLSHPRRPDLCYLYPPPTPTILTNIMHALAAVPKFYVQVLHLMNKMDLPAPFGNITPAPPVHSDIRGYAVTTDNVDQREMDISSETESELESDGEERTNRSKDQEAPAKRPLSFTRRKKRPRLSDLQDVLLPAVGEVGSAGDTTSNKREGQSLAPDVREVFDQALSEHPLAAGRKIELKLPSVFSRKGNNSLPPVPALPPLFSQQSSLPSQQATRATQSKELPGAVTNTTSSYNQVKEGSRYQPDKDLQTIQTEFNSRSKPVETPGVCEGQIPSKEEIIDERQSRETRETNLVQESPCEQVFKHAVHHTPNSGSHDESDFVSSYDVALPPGQTSHEDQPNTEMTDQQDQQLDTGDVSTAGFGLLQPQPRVMGPDTSATADSGEKEWKKTKFVTSSELRKSRLSRSEMKELSVFRRYTEGEPSCRLYIKNLAKQVTEEDIHWIFGRYVNWDSVLETNIFDIRLMKEGRMKGQAFVTLPSEEQATSAVGETNGFMLRDKPMVVQFARSAKAQEDEASKP